jgi:16S rRNA (adenine1518-N6/adenine1519-N6)-dimethyltransferase
MIEPNLLKKTTDKLKAHNLNAKKRFGQNFLISQTALNQILEAANPQKGEQVLEIGPGTGNLTEELLKHDVELKVVEMDPDMIKILKSLQNDHDFELINQDALKVSPSELGFKNGYKVIANLPYYITSPLINKFLKNCFLKQNILPKSLTLMVQLEVAEKICNPKKLNVLRANVITFGEPRIVAKVPASKFYPAPKVDSAIIHIDAAPTPNVDCDLEKYFKVLHAAFGARRKTLKNNLKSLAKAWEFDLIELQTETGIDFSRRAETLSIKEFEAITTFISKNAV